MRYVEINETLSQNILFHFTGITVLLRIILENNLKSNWAFDYTNPNASTISFTRNSAPRKKLPYGRSSACLVLKKQALKTTPYYGDVGKANGKPMSSYSPHDREMEERHIGDTTVLDKLLAICIANKNYIYDIESPEGFKEWEEERPKLSSEWIVLKKICKEHNIPVIFVDDFSPGWFLKIKNSIL